MADRNDIEKDIREALVEQHSSSETVAHSPDGGTHPDRAILGLCDLLGLMFALPFGEDLYHDIPITIRHIAYLVVGLMIAGFGHMWPRIKASLPTRLAQTVALASLDFRIWIVVLVIVFVISVGPEVYQRAIAIKESGVEPQKAALVQWLQQAQGERDQARRERDQAKTSGVSIQATGSAPPPQPPSRFYSPKQKGEVAELIQDTSALIDKYSETIRGLSASVSSVMTMAPRYAPPIKERVATSLRAANTLMETIPSYLAEIQKFERDHAFYLDEINFLGFAEFQRELAAVKDAASSAQAILKRTQDEIDRYPDDRHLHDVFLETASPYVKKAVDTAREFTAKLDELKKRGTVLSQSISQ